MAWRQRNDVDVCGADDLNPSNFDRGVVRTVIAVAGSVVSGTAPLCFTNVLRLDGVRMNEYQPKREEEFTTLPEVRRLLQSNRTRLPYVVEFSGLPKSGKTTIMRRTLRGLDRLGLKCSLVTEAATTKVDRSMRSDLFVFNMLCYFENLRSVVQESQRGDSIDVTLVDRGIIDSFVWFAFLNRIGLLQDDLRRKIEDFASLGTWLAQVNHVVYVKSDWRSYRARFLLDSPVEEPPTLTEEFFRVLSEAYDEVFLQKLPHARIQTINGALESTTDAEKVAAPEILRENWVTAHEKSIEIITAVFSGLIEDYTERIAVLESELFPDARINALRDSAISEFISEVFQPHKADDAQRNASTVKFLERAKVERDLRYVQIIAGAFIRRNGKLLVLRHAQSEKRTALRGQRSILVTGHVDDVDQSLTTGAKNPVENCLFRELKEELVNIDWPKVRPRYGLRIGDDDMGKRHLALIYEVESISRSLGVSALPGAGDFEPNPEFWELARAKDQISEFDNWSQQVINWLSAEE